MKRTDWIKLISSLPDGLTQVSCAKELKMPVGAVRHWIRKLDYRFKDGRRMKWSEARRQQRRVIDPSTIDWTQANVDIAREHSVTREAIRRLRAQLKISKVGGRKSRKK